MSSGSRGGEVQDRGAEAWRWGEAGGYENIRPSIQAVQGRRHDASGIKKKPPRDAFGFLRVVSSCFFLGGVARSHRNKKRDS
jgi:hypothetical protein